MVVVDDGSRMPVCDIVNAFAQGLGTSLKVLDYLWHGLPLVSTPFGMRGYEEFEKYVTLCALSGFRAALGRELRSPRGVFEGLNDYSWSSVSQSLSELLSKLMQSP